MDFYYGFHYRNPKKYPNFHRSLTKTAFLEAPKKILAPKNLQPKKILLAPPSVYPGSDPPGQKPTLSSTAIGKKDTPSLQRCRKIADIGGAEPRCARTGDQYIGHSCLYKVIMGVQGAKPPEALAI